MSAEKHDRASVTTALADWAAALEPSAQDLALADRALLDTVVVGLAAREEPILDIAAVLPEEAQWAVACHIIDFDDLHMPSTTHISTVCVPVVLWLGGGARSYLAGAGVMARVGTALGWSHYDAGWHATTTAGAIGAAAGAATALGLDADGVGRAMALAVPAAGGVQRCFGTDGKSLQIGFAAHAGVRAARLAAAGATADPYAVDDWLALVGGSAEKVDLCGPAIPDGLAIKLYPCCYALQRPIGAAAALRAEGVEVSKIQRIIVRTPKVTVKPLIHPRPRTGLEAKFSLEYSVVAALLDDHIGFAAFTDEQVVRPEVTKLIELVEVELTDGGEQLLSGEVEVEVHTADEVDNNTADDNTADDNTADGNTVRSSTVRSSTMAYPPGSPQNPPTSGDLRAKIADCLTGIPVQADDVTWASAPGLLRTYLSRDTNPPHGAKQGD
jgi:2-methylcitrate dehydratase PrpD